MIMNGLMRKFSYDEYYKQLKTMPDPIMASEVVYNLSCLCRVLLPLILYNQWS